MAVRLMPIVTLCVNQFSLDVPTACFEFEGALFDPRGAVTRTSDDCFHLQAVDVIPPECTTVAQTVMT